MKLELEYLCEEVRKTESLSPIFHLSESLSPPYRQDKTECCHVTLRPITTPGYGPVPCGPNGVFELRDLTPKQGKGFSAGKKYTVTISDD